MALNFKDGNEIFKLPGAFLKKVQEFFAPKTTPPQEFVSPLPDIPLSPTPTPQPTFGRVTYYLPTGGLTATGTKPKSGYTAAISRELKNKIPMGSIIELPNGQKVRIEDLTPEKIKDTLDIYYDKPEFATYPKGGRELNVPYNVTGRETEGLRYNY